MVCVEGEIDTNNIGVGAGEVIEDAWRSSIDVLGELVFIIPLVNSIIPLGGFGSKPLPISSPVPYTDHRPAVVSTTHTLKNSRNFTKYCRSFWSD